jgi:hypothetical protein
MTTDPGGRAAVVNGSLATDPGTVDISLSSISRLSGQRRSL